jgi:2-keto-3-deoxy-6-phosphogluconate aldolase
MEAIAREVPEAVVGAGTVRSAADARRRPLPVPGSPSAPATPRRGRQACRDAGLPLLPGVATGSEIMMAQEDGYTELKFFPAMQAGGAAMLKAWGGPFGDVRFARPGGVTPATRPEFWRCPMWCVWAARGWCRPMRWRQGDWARITVALAIMGNAVLIPVALFYLLMDWEPHRGPGTGKLRAGQIAAAPFLDSFTAEADAGAGPVPARPAAGDADDGAVLQRRAWRCSGWTWRCPSACSLAWPCLCLTWALAWAWCWPLLAGLLQFASAKALVMVAVVFGLGQLIESLYLTPRLVGERIGLHPLAVIFALLAFGQLFGFVGVLVALAGQRGAAGGDPPCRDQLPVQQAVSRAPHEADRAGHRPVHRTDAVQLLCRPQ